MYDAQMEYKWSWPLSIYSSRFKHGCWDLVFIYDLVCRLSTNALRFSLPTHQHRARASADVLREAQREYFIRATTCIVYI